jgi:hypothetical protein
MVKERFKITKPIKNPKINMAGIPEIIPRSTAIAISDFDIYLNK